MAGLDATKDLTAQIGTLNQRLDSALRQLDEADRALDQERASRIAAEAECQQATLEFCTLLDALPHAVWVADAEGGWVALNQVWTDTTGMAQEDSLGHGWITAIHPDDRSRLADRWLRPAEASALCEIECRLRQADGSYRSTLGQATALRDADGAIVKWFGVWIDSSEITTAQARLREQAMVLDHVQEAVLVKDPDDRITFWNGGAERLYGWSAAEVIGRPASELFGADGHGGQTSWTALVQAGAWRGEMTRHTKDEREITVEARLRLLRDAEGQPSAILVHENDITERNTLQMHSLRAQRLEGVGAIAGGIAHDLNNVLAPIVLSVEVLAEQLATEEELGWLTQLQSSADRATELVAQLLSFARGVEGQRLTVNCLRLMRDVIKVLRDGLPDSISLTFTPGQDLWTVTGDAMQLYQVFHTLCLAAQDAMPEGGSLAISMTNVVLDDTYAAMHPGTRIGAYVLVRVEDTGSGSRSDRGDTGLGPTAAILKSHGAMIDGHSEPGKGAYCAVYLPANAAANPAAGIAKPGEARLPQGGGELVLVVDDEDAIRAVVKATLERFGYRVLLAANGAEAVAQFVQHRAGIAVVLTDMAMSVMDGPATIVALRALDPAVKIIGSSGLMSTRGAMQSAGSGIEHFVAKPYTAETLLKTLHNTLRPTRPALA